MAKFLITTNSNFTLQYLVEAPSLQDAMHVFDTETNRDDAHQEWNGEVLLSSKEITDDEIAELSKDWPNSHMIDKLIIR